MTELLIGADKRRIRERTLLLVAACFGTLGGTLRMSLFHHKTRNPRFALGLPIALLIQTGLLTIGMG